MKPTLSLFKNAPKNVTLTALKRNTKKYPESDLYSFAKHEFLSTIIQGDIDVDLADTSHETSILFYDCLAGGTFTPNEKVIIRQTVADVHCATRLLHEICQKYVQLQPNLPSKFVDGPYLAPDQETIMEVSKVYERMSNSTHSLTVTDTRTKHDCARYGESRYYLTTEPHVEFREQNARHYACDLVEDQNAEPVKLGPITFEEFTAPMELPVIPLMMVMGFPRPDGELFGPGSREYEESYLPRKILPHNRGCRNFSQSPFVADPDYFGSKVRIGDNILGLALSRQQRASCMFLQIYKFCFRYSAMEKLNAIVLFDDFIDTAEQLSMI